MSETWKTVDLGGLFFGVWAAQIYEGRLGFRDGNQVQFPALETGTFSYFLIVSFHVTETVGTGIRPRFPSRFLIQNSVSAGPFFVIFGVLLGS